MSFWSRLFTPLSVERVKVTVRPFYTGYMRIYIFGIRIANIQLTNPWE